MKISFHGADRSVTGSCHLVECAGKRILIDCGLYQGSRELDEENAEPFGFDAASIDYVLLTHAHLDHCGRLPLLAKRGFRGEIITTSASRELTRLVVLDAAYLLGGGRASPRAQRRSRRCEQRYEEPALFDPRRTELPRQFRTDRCLLRGPRSCRRRECYLHRRWPYSRLGQHFSAALGTGPFRPACCFPAIWATPVACCYAAPRCHLAPRMLSWKPHMETGCISH